MLLRFAVRRHLSPFSWGKKERSPGRKEPPGLRPVSETDTLPPSEGPADLVTAAAPSRRDLIRSSQEILNRDSQPARNNDQLPDRPRGLPDEPLPHGTLGQTQPLGDIGLQNPRLR